MKNNGTNTTHTRKLVTAALFAAACFGMTMVSVPLPVVGYGNLGDCFVLLAGWLLGPLWGAVAAGLGSALADVALGFAVYAPATFVIKALMAAVACLLGRLLVKHAGSFVRRAASYAAAAVCGECIMVGGYFAYECVLYDTAAALGSVLGNSVQAVVGILLSTVLITVLGGNKVLNTFFKF